MRILQKLAKNPDISNPDISNSYSEMQKQQENLRQLQQKEKNIKNAKIALSVSAVLFTMLYVYKRSAGKYIPENIKAAKQKDVKDFKKNFESVKHIGAGGFGSVFLYCKKGCKKNKEETCECLAVKKINTVNERFVKDEIKHLKKVSKNSKQFVKYYGCEKDKHFYYILMEYINGMTLQDYLYELKDEENMAIKVFVLKEICNALKTLHSKDTSHMDIKPGNIMVVEDGDKIQVKIIDFGISCEIKNKLEDCELGGTLFYMPPEMIKKSPLINPVLMGFSYPRVIKRVGEIPEYSDSKDLKKADVYSFGCVIYEVITGKKLFNMPMFSLEIMVTSPLIILIKNIIFGKHSKIDTGDKDIDELIKSCINFDYKKRPTMNTVCKELNDICKKYIK